MFNQFNKNDSNDWSNLWSRTDLFARIITAGREFYNIFFRRLLNKHISSSIEMLELGCGSATLSLSVADKIKTFIGLDNSPEAIKLASRHAAAKKVKAEFRELNIFNLPQDLKNRFGVVWSQGLMEHFENYASVIQAHYEAAKPGGTILISVPYKYSYILTWHLATRNKFLKRFWPYADQKFLTHKELKKLGGQFSQNYRAYLLPPWPLGLLLGIIILEIKK